MTWRDKARPIIARVLRETADKSDAEIKRALRDAYPWGPREHHPYKTWCDEVKRQRGAKAAGRPMPEDKIERARQAFREAGKPIPAWLDDEERR